MLLPHGNGHAGLGSANRHARDADPPGQELVRHGQEPRPPGPDLGDELTLLSDVAVLVQ